MKPFHLRLESNVAAAFPLMKRFGTITIDVYPAGFRATTIWLRAFSRNPRTITLENPLSRTYVERPMSAIGDIVRFGAGRSTNIGAPRTVQVHKGKAAGLPSHRFRLIYDRTNFVDVWTTTALGPTPAFRAFAEELVRALSPRSAAVLRSVTGTPIYVELNSEEHRKLPVVVPKWIVWNAAGEAAALRVSPWMFPAPFGTIFK